jgi:hypothetical protein
MLLKRRDTMKRLIGAALVLTLILSVAPVLASDALHTLLQLSPEVRATVTLLTDEQLAAVEEEGERFLLFLTTMCSQCRSWSRTWEYRDWPVNTREEYGEQYPAASSAAVAAWIHERNPDLRASHVQTWPRKP